jgi:hypothetical protein
VTTLTRELPLSASNAEGSVIYADSQKASQLSAIQALRQQEFGSNVIDNPPQCFVAGTLIDTPDGAPKAVEAIAPGDMVMAFDLAAEGGRGRLAPARVRRVFSNLTTELLVLSSRLVVTPGHLFLNERGSCQRIDEIIARGGKIARADGKLESVDARKVVYSESTRRLYKKAEDGRARIVRALALRPEIERGWRTYNFEVERLHTYVAGGYRVHNDSLGDMVFVEEEYQKDYGVAWDPNDPQAFSLWRQISKTGAVA